MEKLSPALEEIAGVFQQKEDNQSTPNFPSKGQATSWRWGTGFQLVDQHRH